MFFAVIGLGLIWLPMVDRLSQDDAGFSKAKLESKLYDWNGKKLLDPALLGTDEKSRLSNPPPPWIRHQALWLTTIVASLGILLLVLLNFFLQRHRRRQAEKR